MNKIHAKSPCCRGIVLRFGSRRRQCKKCRKTWRVRRRKRGRKLSRTNNTSVLQYLRHEVPSLHARARVRSCTPDKLERRLLASRDYFLLHTPWPIVPEQVPLLVLADAMIRQVDGKMYTTYFILVRPIDSDEAIILEPLVLLGKENYEGWYQAFSLVPVDILERIKAMVCDAHVGLASVALWKGWPLQWCNFHIIAAIQGRRSRFAASRHRGLGEHLYRLTCQVLKTRNENEVLRLMGEIETVGWETSSKQLRRIISGFVKHVDRYRTYITRPELRLPRTNNSCETLIGEFQKLAHRMRGWNNIHSFEKWLFALIKYKKTIKCKASDQPS